MRFTFSRRLRLCSAADFKHVFDKAAIKVVDKRLLVLASISQQPHPRLGLVVAKKHTRYAVDRNRIKRCIRESFRLRQYAFSGLDIVVLARNGFHKLGNQAMHALLVMQWQKLSQRLAK